MKKNKKKTDNALWCILHALYLLRYEIIGALLLAALVWSYFCWLAGINGTI